MGLLELVVWGGVHRDDAVLVGRRGWCGRVEDITLLPLSDLHLTLWTGVRGRPHSRSTLDAPCCCNSSRL